MPMTKKLGWKPFRLIGCQAAPFHQYLPSWETQAAPSNRAGRPSGAVIASMDPHILRREGRVWDPPNFPRGAGRGNVHHRRGFVAWVSAWAKPRAPLIAGRET